MIDIMIVLGIIFIIMPVSVYLCVKFGVFGYYKGKQLAEDEKE